MAVVLLSVRPRARTIVKTSPVRREATTYFLFFRNHGWHFEEEDGLTSVGMIEKEDGLASLDMIEKKVSVLGFSDQN